MGPATGAFPAVGKESRGGLGNQKPCSGLLPLAPGSCKVPGYFRVLVLLPKDGSGMADSCWSSLGYILLALCSDFSPSGTQGTRQYWGEWEMGTPPS